MRPFTSGGASRSLIFSRPAVVAAAESVSKPRRPQNKEFRARIDRTKLLGRYVDPA
jgi:hypothetical protein